MENFVINREGNKLTGYSWKCEEGNRAICLIHGINEHAGRYDRMAKAFNDEKISFFSMDLRGHGRSSGSRGHCGPREEILKDIDMLIEYIQKEHNIREIVMYGHSMGGNITLDYRSRGKYNGDIKGYVISAPWIRLVRKIPKYQFAMVKTLAKIFPKFKLNSEIEEGTLGNKLNVTGYKKDPLTHNYISAKCAEEGYEIGEKLYRGENEIKGEGVKRPILLMHGDEDKVCSVEGSRKLAQLEGDMCQYIEWKGLYHEIHNGGKTSMGDEVIDTAVKWVKNL